MHSELRLALIAVGLVLMVGIIVDALRRRSTLNERKALDAWNDLPAPEEFVGKKRVVSSTPETKAPVANAQPKPQTKNVAAQPVKKAEPIYSYESPAQSAAVETPAPVQTHTLGPSAEQKPTTTKAPTNPPTKPKDILILGIVPKKESSNGTIGFAGTTLLAALKNSHLEYGRDKAFHKYGPQGENAPAWFSVVQSAEPGIFDLREITTSTYSGVVLYMMIPGPHELNDAFESLVTTARRLTAALNGTLVNEKGVPLAIGDLELLKSRIKHTEMEAI